MCLPEFPKTQHQLVVQEHLCDHIFSVSAHIKQEKFDASLMHMMPEVAAQERMVDDGMGQVEVSVTTKPH